ncbi:MAG: hypothetical protein J4F49_02985 [Rhodobacteraceae bacterium]|nr:hypothetical protein [Paracoccaceae bacterium]
MRLPTTDRKGMPVASQQFVAGKGHPRAVLVVRHGSQSLETRHEFC